MTAKEQLYYLLKHVKEGNYDISTFADLFTNIFNIELHKDDCTEEEYMIFLELNKYTCRFSPFEEDLSIPNVFFNEQAVRKQIDTAIKKLGRLRTTQSQ